LPCGTGIFSSLIPAVHYTGIDAGGRIRPTEWYRRALSVDFEVLHDYPLRAGLWDYSVFVLG
jgi:hypothetical protein